MSNLHKLGRPKTGSAVPFTDERGRKRFKVGITLADGKRTWKRLPPGTSEVKAEDTAAAWNEKAANDPTLLGSDAIPMGETVAEYAKRWLAARHAKGNTSVGDDKHRLSKWLTPTLGPKRIADVTKDDIKGIVEMLDSRVAEGVITAKTAINIWGAVAKLFDDSANSKIRALCVREANPAGGVRGPDRGVEKAKTFLYPAELLTFVGCPDIPMRWRRLVAVAVYTYARPGELEALEWEDVDLEHRVMHIHRAIDRHRGEVKATKTSVPRRLPVEPELFPLLKAMHSESGGKGRVLDMPQVDDLAQFLRKYLKRAGVQRAELYADDATRKNVRFYDLRATGITWRAVRNDPPLEIKKHAGHKRFSTTEIYLREADTLRGAFGEVFPPLPPSLLEGSFDPDSIRKSDDPPEASRKSEWSRRESNPGKPHGKATIGDDRSSSEKSTPAMVSDNPANAGERIESGSKSEGAGDAVEVALARAIEGATAAGQWEVVGQLVRELGARRAASSSPLPSPPVPHRERPRAFTASKAERHQHVAGPPSGGGPDPEPRVVDERKEPPPEPTLGTLIREKLLSVSSQNSGGAVRNPDNRDTEDDDERSRP